MGVASGADWLGELHAICKDPHASAVHTAPTVSPVSQALVASGLVAEENKHQQKQELQEAVAQAVAQGVVVKEEMPPQ